MTPINDAVAGPQHEQEQLAIDYYPRQNAYIRASLALLIAEEQYTHHEIGASELQQAVKRQETALLALESYWAELDSKKEK